MEQGKLYTPKLGTPQGGIVSPLLANIYLHEMDKEWQRRYDCYTRQQRHNRRRQGLGNVELIRYADDFLVLTNGRKAVAEGLKEEFGAILNRLGLTLSTEKTLVTHVDDGVDFLGFHIQRRLSRMEYARKVPLVEPSPKNIQRYKDKIRELLETTDGDVINRIRAVNQVIIGWANYYRYVNSYDTFSRLKYWTFQAVWNWLKRRHRGALGAKALYQKYKVKDPKGRSTLGYGTVYLANMAAIHHQKYLQPKGGFTNPYLTGTSFFYNHVRDEPIAETTWNGKTAQSHYAIARQNLLLRNGPVCQGCQRQFRWEELHAHHVEAQKQGGSHGSSNLVLLCLECHTQTESYGGN